MPQALPDIGCWPAGASLVRGSCPGTTAKGTDLWPIALGLNFLGSGWAIDSFYNCPFTINRLQGMSLDHAESIECPTGGEGVPSPAGLPPIVGGTRRAFLVVLPAYYRGFTCPFTFCGIGF